MLSNIRSTLAWDVTINIILLTEKFRGQRTDKLPKMSGSVRSLAQPFPIKISLVLMCDINTKQSLLNANFTTASSVPLQVRPWPNSSLGRAAMKQMETPSVAISSSNGCLGKEIR